MILFKQRTPLEGKQNLQVLYYNGKFDIRKIS